MLRLQDARESSLLNEHLDSAQKSERFLTWLEKQVWFSWIIVILIAITIFYLSSLSFSGVGNTGSFSYIYHFLAFFWLEFFLLLAIVHGKRKNLIIISILLAIVYAASDEFHQLFTPGRACSFIDFLTDSAGILLASFIYMVRLRKVTQK